MNSLLNWLRHLMPDQGADRQQWHLLVRSLPHIAWVKDKSGHYLACNAAFEQFSGRKESDLVGRTSSDIYPAESAKRFDLADHSTMFCGQPVTTEAWARQPSNDQHLLYATTRIPIRDNKGAVLGLLGIAEDVTLRRQTEDRLQQSNRALRMLSAVNHTLIHSTSEQELLQQVCQIIVESGDYHLAWVGYARDDEAKTIEPVAHAGFQVKLFSRKISWGEGEGGQGPSGKCIRTGQPCIVSDVLADASLVNNRNDLLKAELRSIYALPLLAEGKAFGLLQILSYNSLDSDSKEVSLLTELANDLAFGIQTLRQRAIHAQTELILRLQKTGLELIATRAPLKTTLDTLLSLIETEDAHLRCAILLISEDGRRIRHYAAPSLSSDFTKRLEETFATWASAERIEPFRRQPVIVADIASDPLWDSFRHLAQPLGLNACWSIPFNNAQGSLLGTVTFYSSRPGKPSELHWRMLEMAAQTAAIAVMRQQEEETLRRSEASLAAAQQRAKLGSWELEAATGKFSASKEMRRIYGLPEEGPMPPLTEITKRILREDKAKLLSFEQISRSSTPVSVDYRIRTESGEIRHLNDTTSALRNDAGEVVAYAGTVLDITERKDQENRIEQLAFYDSLTGLPHRALFLDRLNQAVSTIERHGGKLALLFLDLDRFKEINDSQGHDAGDRVLLDVSQRLQAVLRSDETLARLGGDEFTVIVYDGNETSAAIVAERIQAAFIRPFVVDGRSYSLGISIGIALCPDDSSHTQSLVSRADIAMYQAKAQGGGYRFYRTEMSDQLNQRLALARGLERALVEDQLELHYQPQVHLASGQLVGAEALLRWHDSEQGWISPAHFIPVAEERGMMHLLGNWVLRAAALQMQTWQKSGKALPGRLSVNVSGRQLDAPNFANTLAAIVREHGLEPDRFELELTESTLMTDAEHAMSIMAELKSLGFALAIDDFGTGYSSLIYLKRFPADKLKIDMSFVRDMLTDRNDYAIVTTIIAMAGNLGLTTIAEGVEQAAQASALQSLGCEEVQGYLFGRPLPPEEFASRWLS